MPHVTLTIDSVNITQRGPYNNAEDTTTFEFSLYYPAPGVNVINTIKAIKATEKLPDFSLLMRKDKIVFYCDVVDDFELEITASTVDNPSDFSKFIVGVFGVAFKTAFSTITGGIQNVITNEILPKFGDAVNSKIKVLASSQPLGSARVLISKSDLLEIQRDGGRKIIIEDLVIPKDSALLRSWGNTNYEYPLGGHDVLVGPGAINGKIEMTLSVA